MSVNQTPNLKNEDIESETIHSIGDILNNAINVVPNNIILL